MIDTLNKAKNAQYHKCYLDFENSKGLYFITPEGLRKKSIILAYWNEMLVALNGNYVEFPVIVPHKQLVSSGHVNEFKDELFTFNNLALRPEITQSVLPNYPILRSMFKGNPLVIGTSGKVFRNEKTTRNSLHRKNQFEQMDIYAFQYLPETVEQLKTHISNFFKKIGVDFSYVQIFPPERAHYSSFTQDLIGNENVQYGCINIRQYKNKPFLECSIGLDRLVVDAKI